MAHKNEDWLNDGVRELLEEINKEGVRCWIDSGTLLGVCRDGCPPRWDKDIDLGCFLEDFPKCINAISRVARDWGYKLEEKVWKGFLYAIVLRSRRKLYTSPNGEKFWARATPVAIHFFREDLGFFVSHQPHNLLSNGRYARTLLIGDGKRNSLFSEKGSFLEKASRALKMALCVVFSLPGLRGLTMRLIKAYGRRFYRGRHVSQSRIFGFFFQDFYWKVPKEYFSEFEPVPEYGNYVLRPVKFDEYLAARYGDWKTPQSDWVFSIDDGLLERYY